MITDNFIDYGESENFDKIKELALQEDFSRKSMREANSAQCCTRTVVGLFNILEDVPGFMDKGVFFKYYPLLQDLVDTLKEKYNYKSVEVLSLLLVKMEAGGEIPEHIDNNGWYDIAHRVHLPIYTNKECVFTVGGDSATLTEGYFVEINNTVPHSVRNYGEDRLHLIIDIVGREYEFSEGLLNSFVPDGFYIKE